MNLNIVKMMATKFKYYGAPRSAKLDSIEIHSIGTAQDEAEVIANYMNQNSPGGIVHAIVDAKVSGKVVELLPEDNLAWADAGYGNQHSYAIELAESDQIEYTSGASYKINDAAVFKADTYRAYNTAVVYVAKKCIDFGFDPQEELPNGLHRVYSHQEANILGLASNHVDPVHIWTKFGLTMDKFRADVAVEILNQRGVCMIELPVLKRGDKNNYVKNVRRILRTKKYKSSKGKLITVNKRYDQVAENAIKAFQAKTNLPVTGMVDEKTWKRLLNSY